MSRRLKILLRMDVDHNVGLAHAVRVARILSLGREIHGATWDFEVHLVGHAPQYDRFFDKAVTLHLLSADRGRERENAIQVRRLADEIQADVLMVDHPHLTAFSWDIFGKGDAPVIAIDDEGGPVVADLIFNGTILDSYHHYPRMTNAAVIHAGGQYALINPCFAQATWSEPLQAGIVSVIGSGDRACEWALKLTHAQGPLSNVTAARKTMIVGSAFPKMEQLRAHCGAAGVSLHQNLDQVAIAELLCQHSLGLITGGMIVYEALACGLPILIFPQEENLPPEARYFADRKGAVDLGYDGGMDMMMVGDEIEKLMAAQDARRSLSRNARRMIDGKGMLRTVRVLDGFMETVQKRLKEEDRS